MILFACLQLAIINNLYLASAYVLHHLLRLFFLNLIDAWNIQYSDYGLALSHFDCLTQNLLNCSFLIEYMSINIISNSWKAISIYNLALIFISNNIRWIRLSFLLMKSKATLSHWNKPRWSVHLNVTENSSKIWLSIIIHDYHSPGIYNVAFRIVQPGLIIKQYLFYIIQMLWYGKESCIMLWSNHLIILKKVNLKAESTVFSPELHWFSYSALNIFSSDS